jgi:hypothetical protein
LFWNMVRPDRVWKVIGEGEGGNVINEYIWVGFHVMKLTR